MRYPRIRALRESAGLTQKQIAKKLFMYTTTYNRYESAEREVPLSAAVLLAKYYNVSVDYIAGLTDRARKLRDDDKTEQ